MNNKSNTVAQRYTAIVLAANRTDKDPITKHTGAACKAFAPVGGIPMVIRVLDTLAACDLINAVILCGPPESMHEQCPALKKRIVSGQINWVPSLDSPSHSADSAINRLPNHTPVLLTTADHALLTPDIVQKFLHASMTVNCDATVGAISEQALVAAFPDSKRTIIRLRDGGFHGCNLYTFNPKGRALIGFWRKAEKLRKKPWQLIAQVLGFKTVLLYLFGLLTKQKALAALSEKSGVNIKVIMLNDPRAGIDVDKIEDLVLTEKILNQDAKLTTNDKNL